VQRVRITWAMAGLSWVETRGVLELIVYWSAGDGVLLENSRRRISTLSMRPGS
jgi:hypothetical protein